MTPLEVIRAVDPLARIDKCPLELEEHKAQLCPLHQSLDRAIALVEAAFAATTIADMTGPRPAAKTSAAPPVPPEPAKR